MPKRREPAASAPTTEQVEAFASGANTAPKQLDPWVLVWTHMSTGS